MAANSFACSNQVCGANRTSAGKLDCTDGHDGPRFQQELKRRRQKIPIILVTAHRDEVIRDKVLALGGVDCLFKPLSDTALLEALNLLHL
jgi:FixJ family two-component response regulator